MVGEWSGKAMQLSVPAGGTDIWEMVTRDNGEGHRWYAASLVRVKRALAEPKNPARNAQLHRPINR
jgi:hypothetical protein